MSLNQSFISDFSEYEDVLYQIEHCVSYDLRLTYLTLRVNRMYERVGVDGHTDKRTHMDGKLDFYIKPCRSRCDNS